MVTLIDRIRGRKSGEQDEDKKLQGTLAAYPHLMALKPRERYLFRSDYFELDSSVASVLSFFHDEGGKDEFAAFWGVQRIPFNLPDGVTVVVLEQVRRRGEKWIDDHQKLSDRLDKMNENETDAPNSAKRKMAKIMDDLDVVHMEIANGASYLSVHNRLLVKAPNLGVLEEAITKIEQLYIDSFATLKVAPYHGEQRPEMSSLFKPNGKKRGRGFGFTSTEYAGSYSLVTNGINDPTGEYVGYMVGDVNNSAGVFDVDGYDHHVVVANSAVNEHLDRAYVSDMWGSKISQSALLNNHRVVHINLSDAKLDNLGPRLDNLTYRVDMNSGDVNMFEMFGEVSDELSIFPAHLQKIVLMAEQAFETTSTDRSIIRGSLEEILTEFYVEQGMWYRNAKHNRDRLRVVGIPHNQVPKLEVFVSYLDNRYKSLVNSDARDDAVLHAFSVLRVVFRNLLENNGDLFNTETDAQVDGIREGRRVIYDFGRLRKRGQGVAMAQLVNIIGFATDYLTKGDTVIIHGAEYVDERVRDYMTTQFSHLFVRGGRVVFLYNSVEGMLANSEFNRFDAADYTILGPMRDAVVNEYQTKLSQQIPRDLIKLITRRGENLVYLRRGVTNVVFAMDLALGINPERAAKRRGPAPRIVSTPTSSGMGFENKHEDTAAMSSGEMASGARRAIKESYGARTSGSGAGPVRRRSIGRGSPSASRSGATMARA